MDEGAARKRLATTIPGQSFLWGQVPGYKTPERALLRIQRLGDQEIGVFDIL
jgi:hypothetical protein